MLRRILLSLLLAASAFAGSFRFAAVWDGERLQKDVCVNTREDRVTNVGKCEVGATDLSRYTAIPGLIDVHTHLTSVRRSPVSASGQGAATVYLATENARKTLEAGVTTVRDLNSRNHADIAMRDLINAGLMVGPRMFVAGTALHLDRGHGGGPVEAMGVAAVMQAVRAEIAAGVDQVKMFGSRGGGQNLTADPTFTYEEMKAAVNAAHAEGKRIAIHSYGPAGARDAVRAGADSLEHAIDIDDATLAEMVSRRIWYVPTIDHNRYYAENYKLLGFREESVANFHDFIQRNLATAKRAWRAGVRFAMGSDANLTMHGENTRELTWFVKAGMTPEQALRAATVNGAELLGKEKLLGALRAGYFADVVGVEGDPLADIGVVTNKVRWVMKAGQVIVDRTK